MCITIFQNYQCINCPVDKITGPIRWYQEVEFKPCLPEQDKELLPCPKTELQFLDNPEIVKGLCDKCRKEVKEEKRVKAKSDRDDRDREEAKKEARKAFSEMLLKTRRAEQGPLETNN